MTENEIGTLAIASAIAVHRELGPGLLESVYQKALLYELIQQGLSVKAQVNIPVKYKREIMDIGFRADILIENKVLLELKSVEKIQDVHKKQVQTYLKLTRLKLGYIFNFNTPLLKNGIVRCVNGLDD
ncbi:GxxExxY protein [Fidelibacter multiformis]|uniref:GxxExxY protein n=1 Tax=Fidelibacter multiformis TaxID=3377529 RepID=UPI0037DD87B1